MAFFYLRASVVGKPWILLSGALHKHFTFSGISAAHEMPAELPACGDRYLLSAAGKGSQYAIQRAGQRGGQLVGTSASPAHVREQIQ